MRGGNEGGNEGGGDREGSGKVMIGNTKRRQRRHEVHMR